MIERNVNEVFVVSECLVDIIRSVIVGEEHERVLDADNVDV